MSTPPNPTMLLSFDLEDWAQLTGAEVERAGWDAPGPSFERQMRAIFDLLDTTGHRATFFLLGMTMRNYPDVAREIARRGDEVACHGYGHARVFNLDRDAFRRDVEEGVETAEKLTGRRPIGYRAPAFSITRDTLWALDVLAELGFAYDSSLYDSPRIPRRILGIPSAPCTLKLPSGREITEFPLARWSHGRFAVPVGGGSYWRFLPRRALAWFLRDLGTKNPFPAFYFHPYECDPEYLVAEASPGAALPQRLRAAWLTARYRPGQKRVLPRLRTLVETFQVTTYEHCLQQLRDDPRPRTLSEGGVIV